MATRAKTAPETDAIPAFPMSVEVRLRLSRIMGIRGGAAKVDTKQEKKDIHDKWKALICGAAIENNLNSVALCSESTGRANLEDIDSSLPEISILVFGFSPFWAKRLKAYSILQVLPCEKDNEICCLEALVKAISL